MSALIEAARDALEAWDSLPRKTYSLSTSVSEWLEYRMAPTIARLRAALAAAERPAEPVTLADVLDALNVFNRPKPSEDDGPWQAEHFIRVDHLPAFINIIAAAWFSRDASPAAPAQAPLTDEQLSALILATVYDGDERIPYRDYWTRDIGEPFARAIERAHGIGSKA